MRIPRKLKKKQKAIRKAWNIKSIEWFLVKKEFDSMPCYDYYKTVLLKENRSIPQRESNSNEKD